MYETDCPATVDPMTIGGLQNTNAGYAEAPRLLLIDPKPLTRSHLAHSIRNALSGSVVDIGDVQEVHGLVERGAYFDAVILNLGDEAFDAARLEAIFAPVRGHYPDCGAVLLTSRMDAKGIGAAIWEGVQAYLPTDRSLAATLDAIRFVCTGWLVYPTGGLAHLRSMLAGPPAVEGDGIDPEELTPRQAEVLHCLAAGMSNRGIASHLRISQSTVKAHVKGIMLRFGAANRTQAVALLRADRAPDQRGIVQRRNSDPAQA